MFNTIPSNFSKTTLRLQTPTEMPWHKALESFNLNFDMETFPLGYLDGNGQHQTLADVHGMRRVDTLAPLPGVSVGKRYNIIQNSSYADIGDRICQQFNAKFVAGGLFKGGRVSFLTAKLPTTIRVRGKINDEIENYITFINSFDGSFAFTILPTAFRLLCENQLPAMKRMSRNSGLTIWHSASADARLKEADKAYMEITNTFRAFEVKVNELATAKFTDKMMDLAARKLFSVEPETPEAEIHKRKLANINKVKELAECGKGQKGFEGTAWAFFNGATEWSDYHRTLRSTTNPWESKLIGSGALLKAKAMNVVEEVIAQAA